MNGRTLDAAVMTVTGDRFPAAGIAPRRESMPCHLVSPDVRRASEIVRRAVRMRDHAARTRERHAQIRSVLLGWSVVLAGLLFISARAGAVEVPRLTRFVTDLAGVMSPAAADDLNRTLAAYDQQTSSQFVVLIVPSLEGESIEDFSLAVAEKNGIGRKGTDNGLLLLVAVNDRKLRFEVGYGLEGVLTDALTSVIISDVITPRFRQGDYDGGITQGMQAAIKAASGEFTAPEPQREKKKRGMPVGLIVLLIILFIVFRKGGRGGRGGGIFIIPGGFGGGGFGGGGFGGGGFGGGGGFSGGGGGFGGGGSSGSW